MLPVFRRFSGQAGVAFGVVFCHQDINNNYKVVTPTGGRYHIDKEVNDVHTTIRDRTGSAFLLQGFGVVNILRVEFDGAGTFDVPFNGNPVTSFTDPTFASGRSGYFVAVSTQEGFPATPVDVRFKMSAPAIEP